MTKRRYVRAATLLAASLFVPLLVGQPAPKPLPAEAQKRLDHHIGEWDVRTELLGRDGQVVRTTTARDSARYIIPGRVVELTNETLPQGRISKAWMFYNNAEAKFYLTSVDGSGDHWVLEAELDYGDGEPYRCVFIFELRDGLIARETAYWSRPFPAPEWRAPWVERL